MIDTTSYKVRLEGEKARLEMELLSVGRRNPSNPADWEAVPEETGQEADILDAGVLIEGYEGNTGILKELETRLQDVLAALSRIDTGSFGICLVGAEPIEEDRLQADPAASTCKKHITG